MNDSTISLREVDRIEVLTLIDNYVDVLLPSTGVVTRPPLAKGGGIPSDTLLAEHGLSMLVTVYAGADRHTILFDTGYSPYGVTHNIGQLEIDLKEVEGIVLSHGHMDHTGSLFALLDKIPGKTPLVLHPDALLSHRYLGLGNGKKVGFPCTLTRDRLEAGSVKVLESKAPTLMADNTILVTGEVERVTDFEKGLPNALMERDEKLVKDPILDDQSLIIILKGKGVVVISGCAHAGIINTLLFSRKLTGMQKIHAVLGGFHLSGPQFEPIIEETICQLKEIAPEILVPMHCTGWRAINRLSEEFPGPFILNSVGSRFTLS